jgi:hypothetical protein
VQPEPSFSIHSLDRRAETSGKWIRDVLASLFWPQAASVNWVWSQFSRGVLQRTQQFVHAEYLVPTIAMAEQMPRTEALHLAMLVGVTRDLLRLQQRVTELEAINRDRSGG